MKFVLGLVAALALAVGFNLVLADHAEARCWKRCRVLAVPVVPVVPVAPAAEVIAVPAPNPIPRYEPVPCGGCYASYFYPSYNVAGAGYAVGGCGIGVRCYPRRDCWYDGYGRRFCN